MSINITKELEKMGLKAIPSYNSSTINIYTLNGGIACVLKGENLVDLTPEKTLDYIKIQVKMSHCKNCNDTFYNQVDCEHIKEYQMCKYCYLDSQSLLTLGTTKKEAIIIGQRKCSWCKKTFEYTDRQKTKEYCSDFCKREHKRYEKKK